ncbi:MAG: hypothetical protein KDD44_12720 [Bdellovibrionales bacterium]|nr:hypothetical protein [Bdellovibrionales bacterium]
MVNHRLPNGQPARRAVPQYRDLPIRYRPSKTSRTITACGVSDFEDTTNPGTYVRVAHKFVDRRFHFRNDPPAIGWAVEVVAKLRRLEVERLLVVDTYTHAEYRADLSTLLEHGFPDRLDSDLQMFLEIKYWKIRHPVIEAKPDDNNRQLGLFDTDGGTE